jgi:hypothetical protein
MSNVIVWALSTGLVTGAVWAAILIYRHQRRLPPPTDQREVEAMRRRLEELENVAHRLTEAEERLDFTEHLLMKKREEETTAREED